MPTAAKHTETFTAQLRAAKVTDAYLFEGSPANKSWRSAIRMLRRLGLSMTDIARL